MLQLCVCRDIEHAGSLDSTKEAQSCSRLLLEQFWLTPLSCSPNFPRAQYLDIRTLTHELIVNFYYKRALKAVRVNVYVTIFFYLIVTFLS